MARIEFDDDSSPGLDAVVASFDLSGFSDFCNHPDAYAHVPRFISSLFDEVNKFFLSWFEAAGPNDKVETPNFMKYTGDGALMIWLLASGEPSRQQTCQAIVRSLRALQQHLISLLPRWEVQWQLHSLPKRARFGIAKGRVYPLRGKSITLMPGPVEDYVGYCINLAVRLQNHCREVDFLVHSPVLAHVPEDMFKLIALNMKGTRDEPVLLFAHDLAMPFLTLRAKFSPIGNDPDPRLKPFHFPDADSSTPPQIMQPRFEARFEGGPMNGSVAFLPARFNEWNPIIERKGPDGAIVHRQVSHYRLKNEVGLQLHYVYVGPVQDSETT